ncbi:hypothetical protein HY572_04615 [Candidatus Micrarchaeota archaeon]|nr:hypothetical protein [Candidatus Micrarchaeota archaeon]
MHDAFQQIGNLEHVEPICGSVQTFRLPSDFFDQVHFFNVFNSYPFGMSLLPWMEDHLGVVKPGGLVLVGNTHTPNLTWMDQIAPVFARRGFSAEQLAYWDPAKSELSARQRERFVKFMGSGVLNHITPGAVLVAFKKRKA